MSPIVRLFWVIMRAAILILSNDGKKRKSGSDKKLLWRCDVVCTNWGFLWRLCLWEQLQSRTEQSFAESTKSKNEVARASRKTAGRVQSSLITVAQVLVNLRWRFAAEFIHDRLQLLSPWNDGTWLWNKNLIVGQIGVKGICYRSRPCVPLCHLLLCAWRFVVWMLEMIW